MTPSVAATVDAGDLANGAVGAAVAPKRKAKPAFGILGALSGSHMINDMMQSLILAMYPILKGEFSLSFAQIGLITLTYQLTASLLQPLVGLFTDRRPQPYSLPFGMLSTLIGAGAAGVRAELRNRAAGGRLRGHRLVDLPSGIVARRAPGLGRPARLRAVGVPGRRQHRHGDRPAAGGGRHRAVRPAQRRLVRAGGAAGHRPAGAGQPLVCRASHRRRRRASPRPPRRRIRARWCWVPSPCCWC